jgi:phage terminase small subunit
MARQERSKKSTAANMVEAFKSANDIPEPAFDLTPLERSHYERVITSREISTWSANHILLASNLARTYRRLDELNERLDREGYTQVNERGTQISNPIFAAMTQIQGQVQALNKTLGLSAAMTGVSGQKQAGRNQAEQDARGVIKRASADDLLA